MNKIKELKELSEKFKIYVDEEMQKSLLIKIIDLIVNELEEKEFDFEKWKKELKEFKELHNHHIRITQKIGYKCTSEELIQIKKYIDKHTLSQVKDIRNIIYDTIIIYGVEIIIDDKNPAGFFIIEEKPKFNEPWEPKMEDTYYAVSEQGNIIELCNINIIIDTDIFNFGNYFKTYEQAEQRAKEIKVYNLLQKFSDANGGDEIDWRNEDQKKYYIIFDNICELFGINYHNGTNQDISKVYFISEEVAEEALRRYGKELEVLKN